MESAGRRAAYPALRGKVQFIGWGSQAPIRAFIVVYPDLGKRHPAGRFASGHAVIGYTDLDLTYPLDQLGLLLAALGQPSAGAAIGARRLPDSHGYYPPAGPNPAAMLYQQAVRELLGLGVTDPQAGFKAFTASALHDALPRVADHGLSFDTDLLAAVTAAGRTVTETGVAALHRYTDGHAGTPRNYDVMLRAVYEQAVRHGHDPAERDTPAWDKIRAEGLTAAARSRPVGVTISAAPSGPGPPRTARPPVRHTRRSRRNSLTRRPACTRLTTWPGGSLPAAGHCRRRA